ncbi:MAG: PhnD/SsuA/transferrin family substrate-binding protein [Candidatus Omnitrophica bacterium]|nr:PhnD/SsuA/transferrin family substrate-binding protein [Candidatus Omnitrophota bacterium]
MKKNLKLVVLVLMIFYFGSSQVFAGDVLKFVIMVSDDPAQEAHKYAFLADYIKTNVSGIDDIKLETAQDYPMAVDMFKSGAVDGMFAGSFVAAVFIKKGYAVPVVRPVSNEGVSTYKAIVVARTGTPVFNGLSDLKNKNVAYCALASSGEVFVRGLTEGENPNKFLTPQITSNHISAIRAVINQRADYAIVKNLTYKNGNEFPGTVQVGEDSAENPNNTMILTKKTYEKYGKSIEEALTQLETQSSPTAQNLKESFKAKGFIKTTEQDFEHTFALMEKAKVNPLTFNFDW